MNLTHYHTSKGKPMQCPNEADAEENILKPALSKSHFQHSINQKTALRYESLSYFEREKITRWLKYNLVKIPMSGEIKRTAMVELLSNNYCYPDTLVLIRHTLVAMGFKI
jgi:hypothetical protein